MATAGLYEIEELVAEIHEEDPLLDRLSQEIDEAEKQINANKKQSQKVSDSNEESRDERSLIPLSISLDVSLNKGLTATPYWHVSKDQKDRAYGSNKVNNLENTDCPALMSFVAEAGRQFFILKKVKDASD